MDLDIAEEIRDRRHERRTQIEASRLNNTALAEVNLLIKPKASPGKNLSSLLTSPFSTLDNRNSNLSP
jgi:hypothetical protein